MKTVAIDFDGVIAQYEGFKGKGAFGPPIPGAREAILNLAASGCRIIINTTRSETANIKDYLTIWGIPWDYVNFNPDNHTLNLSPSKVIADVYIDDRNIAFDGKWEGMVEKVLNFKPWYRR